MATKVWTGSAANIQGEWTDTIAGTWATSETRTYTIDGIDLVYTVGTDTTTSKIAEQLAAMINASSRLTSSSDGSSNFGGQSVGQFAEIEATASGSVVTVKMKTAGKPTTITAAETSASGTATFASTVTATGKHFWDNPDNWEDGSVPVDDDDIYFANSAVDCLYGLPDGTLDPDTLHVMQSFTGRLGLARTNTDAADKPYKEWRPRYVHLSDGATGIGRILYVGEGTGGGSPRVNVQWDDVLYQANIYKTGTPPSGEKAAVNLICDWDGDGDIFIDSGMVEIGPDPGDGAAFVSARVGTYGGSDSGAVLYCGPGCDAGVIVLNSGTIYSNGTLTSQVTQNGGVLYHNETGSPTISTAVINGGTSHYNSKITITNLSVGAKGIATFGTIAGGGASPASGGGGSGGGAGGTTVTNCTAYDGAQILDPTSRATFTNGVDLPGQGLSAVTIDFGPGVTVTPSAI